MSLLRSICCLFGGSCGEEPKATNERPVAADLGQEEAEQEKTGKEQMSSYGRWRHHKNSSIDAAVSLRALLMASRRHQNRCEAFSM